MTYKIEVNDSDFSKIVAPEYRSDHKFRGAVGKFEITANAVIKVLYLSHVFSARGRGMSKRQYRRKMMKKFGGSV